MFVDVVLWFIIGVSVFMFTKSIDDEFSKLRNRITTLEKIIIKESNEKENNITI